MCLLQSIVKKASTLAEHLRALYPASSGNAIKKLLEHDRVKVNGVTARIGKTALRPGDRVEVQRKAFEKRLHEDIDLLYEDEHILVIHKKENMLTIATEREKKKTAYAYLYGYVKRQKPENNIFIAHRLDRKASGLLVFARSEEAKRKLQAQFHDHTVDRQYIAVVEGRMKGESGAVQNYLAENRAYKVYVTDDPQATQTGPHKSRQIEGRAPRQSGKLAISTYRVCKRSSKYTWVEVTTRTGRKHQVRVHLAGLGHPIIGDKEYGSVKNPLNRLGLHASRLGFVHPITGKKLVFEVDAPLAFRKMFAR
jgi:23S rRNA pseudouridine1911/1915/1917 synthase